MLRGPLVISKCREFDAGRELKLGRWSRPVEGDKRLQMTEVLMFALVPIAVGAVAVVLLLGLHNMARGGSPHRSQKLMRLRVLLQFIAIVVIMLTIWAIGK
jgi:hypoxia induced protein